MAEALVQMKKNQFMSAIRAMPKFSGEKDRSIDQWLTDYDDLMCMVGDDFLKLCVFHCLFR